MAVFGRRARQESLDAEPLVARRHTLGDLLRLQDDVLVLAGLVALHLLLALDRLAGLLVDVLAVHAIARLAVQDVKGQALGRRRPRVERDRKSKLPNFHVTLPGCPGRPDIGRAPGRERGCKYVKTSV